MSIILYSLTFALGLIVGYLWRILWEYRAMDPHA